MRVTDRLQQNQWMRMVRQQSERLERAEREAITGRKLISLSDAPADGAELLALEGRLRDIDQFRQTGIQVTTRLSTVDAALDAARGLLDQARQITLDGVPADPEEARQAAARATAILDQVIALGNTRIGNDYVFGGGRTDRPPFAPDGTYQGDGVIRQAEIAEDLVVDVGKPGDAVFGSAISALKDLITNLQAVPPSPLGSVLSGLEQAGRDLVARQTETGALLGQVRDQAANLGRRAAIALDRREAIRDADPTESLMRLTALQSALERSYAVIGRVLSTTLADYLR
jgi:flagellar hook-associated protein 3 FlgL